MSETLKAAIIVSIGLALGGFLLGGVYETSGGPGAIHVVNKFTGSVQFCRGNTCQKALRVMSDEEVFGGKATIITPQATRPGEADNPFADLISKKPK